MEIIPSTMKSKDILEKAFKKFSVDNSVCEVLDINLEPALNKGENYMSDIVRIRAKLLLGNSRTIKKSFIMKKQLEDSVMNVWANDVFSLEAMVYNKILKEMEDLMNEFQDTGEIIWCELYDHGPTYLLFEDLKASGYVLADRKTGLDLDEGLYVLYNLARFHALSKVLEMRGIFSKEMLKPFIPTTDKDFIKGIIHSGMVTCSKAIRESWGSSWEKVADKINLPYESLVEKLKELGQLDEKKFNVLNHGDVWPNNFMFKYDWKKRPIAFKLLDYQLCHYNSCCWDVVFFLFYSMVPSVRRANLNKLIHNYHKFLTQTLRRYKYEGPKPTLGELTSEIERISFYGYCLLCSEYPPLVTDMMDGYEIGGVMDDSKEGGYSIDVYKDPRLVEKIGPDLIQFVEKFLNV